MAKKEGKIDMQAIMEIYNKVGTPGEPHKKLAKLDHQDQGVDGT
jgi:D-mannonate dehydratase